MVSDKFFRDRPSEVNICKLFENKFYKSLRFFLFVGSCLSPVIMVPKIEKEFVEYIVKFLRKFDYTVTVSCTTEKMYKFDYIPPNVDVKKLDWQERQQERDKLRYIIENHLKKDLEENQSIYSHYEIFATFFMSGEPRLIYFCMFGFQNSQS